MALVWRIEWASVNQDGSWASPGSHSGGVEVRKDPEAGRYGITFKPPFQDIPSIVGSQTRYGDLRQATTDNVVFPALYKDSATAITGGGDGAHVNRPFSFIVIGPPSTPIP